VILEIFKLAHILFDLIGIGAGAVGLLACLLENCSTNGLSSS
jgi:hypothetical protein